MKIHQLGIIFVCFISLSACVTQQLVDEDNKQIVRDEATGEQLASTRISLALNYLKIGDVTQAKRNLETAKGFAPNMVQVHTAFAHFYERVGEIESAKDAFEKALILDSSNPDTLNNYGVFLCKQGDLAGAEKHVLKAIAVPTYLRVAQSYENLSVCNLDSDNFKKAEFYIEKAIQHSSQRSSSILQMAYIQYAKGDYSEALKYVNHHDTVNRRYTARSLALSYRLQRKFNSREKAKGFATLLVNTFPKSKEAKEYITSSLTDSEADQLAKRYQKYKQENKPKRRLKFSPNKKPVEVIQASGPLRISSKPKITERVIATPLAPKREQSFAKKAPNKIEPVIASLPKVTERVVAPPKVERKPQPVIAPAPKVAERVVAPPKVVRKPQPVIASVPKVAERVVTPTKVERKPQPVIASVPKVAERVVVPPKVVRKPQPVIAPAPKVAERVVTPTKVVRNIQPVVASASKVAERVVAPVKVVRNVQPVVSAPKVVKRIITTPTVTRNPQQVVTTAPKIASRVITAPKVTSKPQPAVKKAVKKQVEIEEDVKDQIETYSRGKYRVAVQMINNLAPKEYIEEIDGIEVLDINVITKRLNANSVKAVASSEKSNTSDSVLTHTMSKGDNLFRVALGNNVTISSLLAWNNLDLEKASSIKEGDVIYLEDPSQATR